MPHSNRQLKVIALLVFITVLALYYVANGARLTHDSEFYKRTLAAIEHKKDAEARQHILEEERSRLDRVERLQKEHDAAIATATNVLSTSATQAAGASEEKPHPIVEVVEDATADGEKNVAGRKKVKDGKIVNERPPTDKDDGVAKVGNVGAKPTSVAKPGATEHETEAERKVEVELNDILKKGPIIIFSKTFCPFSKKAKHILLDLYSITPAPYVVELDQHSLGPALQDELLKATNRRTVPNILINGKSIGGGDDIEALHESGRLIETVQNMGGKRIVSISANSQDSAARAEVKFKA